MIVVIDTNIIYQALRSSAGASHYIMQLIRDQKITIAVSMQVFNEYSDVLTRPDKLKDLGFAVEDIDKVLRFIAYIGKPYVTYYLFRPNLKDEKDNIFVELALTSNAKYLVTSNIRDYKDSDLLFDDLTIITPGDFVRLWRNKYEV